MCGIIGYIGSDQNSTAIVLDGLMHLVHRGYDSMGLCRQLESGEIDIFKIAGSEDYVPSVDDLKKKKKNRD